MFAAAKLGKLKAPGTISKVIKKRKLKNADMILLPTPRPRQIDNNNNNSVENTITKISLDQRLILGTKALLGKVDFCLSMHKKFPDMDAIWDVYGKVVNIKQHKTTDEWIYLLRNENSGPIMQAICKGAGEAIQQIEKGSYLRVVGRFVGINRFHVYSVNQISEEIWNYSFVELHKMVENTLHGLQRN